MLVVAQNYGVQSCGQCWCGFFLIASKSWNFIWINLIEFENLIDSTWE